MVRGKAEQLLKLKPATSKVKRAFFGGAIVPKSRTLP
jgi:hypothetical protein